MHSIFTNTYRIGLATYWYVYSLVIIDSEITNALGV